MSQENVEIVRRYLAASNDGAWKEQLAAFIDDDVEIDWTRSPAPYRGLYRGRREATQFFEALDVWADARLEPSEFIDAGDDVLVPHVVRLRGRDGIELAVRSTYVFTIRNGVCVSWRIYQEHAEALEAAGLSE